MGGEGNLQAMKKGFDIDWQENPDGQAPPLSELPGKNWDRPAVVYAHAPEEKVKGEPPGMRYWEEEEWLERKRAEQQGTASAAAMED